MAVYFGVMRFLFTPLFLLSLASSACAQDTTGVIRITDGAPVALKKITVTQMETTLQKKAMKLAVRYHYKPNRDWEDTIKYWSDGAAMSAVSFINSSFEYTTVVFNQHGGWLQTSAYPNPEFNETSKIVDALQDKGYSVPSLNSPIGSIIKYHTTHDTWYEVRASDDRAPQTIVNAVLDRGFHFIGLKK